MIPQRFIADGDCVVVEARGDNVTNGAARYNNSYCFVFRLSRRQACRSDRVHGHRTGHRGARRAGRQLLPAAASDTIAETSGAAHGRRHQLSRHRRMVGRNPGISLKETPDGPFVSVASFFRVVLSPHGRGHA
jgi:hypothetical protein